VTVAPSSRNSEAPAPAPKIPTEESPREALQNTVRARIAEVLKATLDAVPIDQPFKALGVDSMMGVEIVMNLEEEFGMTLPETLMFDYPTISALSTFLADSLQLPAVTAKEEEGGLSDEEALDEVLTVLETTSTEEPLKLRHGQS
jgi:acyl carrier protein